MRRFVIDSKDLISAITRLNSVVITGPFIIANNAEDGVMSVTDYSTGLPLQRYLPVYKDVEKFRQGLETGFKCIIDLTGDDKIVLGRL